MATATATATRTRKAPRKPARKPLTPAQAEARKIERAARVAAVEAAAAAFDLDEAEGAELRAYTDLNTHYSDNNAQLILAQAALLGLPVTGLDSVGGYGAFQERGRQVRKGEHARIFIWAPAGTSADADKEQTEPAAVAGETTVRKFFKLAGLFHQSQTDPK